MAFSGPPLKVVAFVPARGEAMRGVMVQQVSPEFPWSARIWAISEANTIAMFIPLSLTTLHGRRVFEFTYCKVDVFHCPLLGGLPQASTSGGGY